ncbi:hypothetical protein LINPERPRIM_LOCUS16804 [Linum perenne]
MLLVSVSTTSLAASSDGWVICLRFVIQPAIDLESDNEGSQESEVMDPVREDEDLESVGDYDSDLKVENWCDCIAEAATGIEGCSVSECRSLK